MDGGSLILIVVPLGFGAAGYLGTRLIERKWFDEKLDRARKAAQLKREMNEAGLDIDELEAFTQLVVGDRKGLRKREDSVAAALPSGADSGHLLTQPELNDLARSRAESAANRLQYVTVEFADELERDEAYHLKQAMDAWEIVAENHAQLSCLLFRGGTAASGVYWAERERMTVTRIAEIETLLAERRALVGERSREET